MPIILISIITGIIGSSVLKKFPHKLKRIDLKDINLSFMLINTSLSLVMYFLYEGMLTQAYHSIIGSVLLLIALIDIRHMVIPDALIIVATVLTVGYMAMEYYIYGSEIVFSQILMSILVPVLLFLFLMALPGDGIGEGDILLGGLFGLILGVDKVVSLLIISFAFFIIISLVMMNKRKRGMDIRLPFAPFMIAGFYIIQIMERVWG